MSFPVAGGAAEPQQSAYTTYPGATLATVMSTVPEPAASGSSSSWPGTSPPIPHMGMSITRAWREVSAMSPRAVFAAATHSSARDPRQHPPVSGGKRPLCTPGVSPERSRGIGGCACARCGFLAAMWRFVVTQMSWLPCSGSSRSTRDRAAWRSLDVVGETRQPHFWWQILRLHWR